MLPPRSLSPPLGSRGLIYLGGDENCELYILEIGQGEGPPASK